MKEIGEESNVGKKRGKHRRTPIKLVYVPTVV